MNRWLGGRPGSDWQVAMADLQSMAGASGERSARPWPRHLMDDPVYRAAYRAQVNEML